MYSSMTYSEKIPLEKIETFLIGINALKLFLKQKKLTMPDTNNNTPDNSHIDDLIRFARAYCAEQLPWFAPALFQCNIQLTDKVPLAAIDQHLNIYFNPKSVQKIVDATDTKSALSQLGFVWIHEISHILREHGDRAKAHNASHGLWNVAADLEINDSKWEGLAPPDIFPLVFPKTYDLPEGQITEYYYQKLKEQQEKKKKEKQEQSKESKEDEQTGPGDNADNPDSPSDSDNKNQEPNQDQGQDEEQDNDTPDNDSTEEGPAPEDNHPDEGSGVHGTPREWELEQEAPEAVEEMNANANTKQHKEELEVEMIRKEVAQKLKEREKGNVPGGWERWAEDRMKSKVNWKQVLKHRMNIAVSKGIGSRVDYSYKRPGRRQSSHPNIIMPSLRGDVSARIACVVDTSGSIKDDELSQIIGEILGVLKAYQFPVTVIPCDARAYTPIQIAIPSDFFKLQKLPGGGGTDMIVGIEAALNLVPKPDCILVLTDGFTPFPKKLYKTPVLFGILKMDGRRVKMPPNPPWRKDLVVEITN